MTQQVNQPLVSAVQRLVVVPIQMNDNAPSKELKELNDRLADDWKFVSMVAPSCGDKVIVCVEKRVQRIGTPSFGFFT